jgi:hypothetical protein
MATGKKDDGVGGALASRDASGDESDQYTPLILTIPNPNRPGEPLPELSSRV